METINIPLTTAFEAKTMELAERFQKAKAGEHFNLQIFDSGSVLVDSALAFHDILQVRAQPFTVHIHSHVCLFGAEVLLWLAGDTRTLRTSAWIHFHEYPRQRLKRSDI